MVKQEKGEYFIEWLKNLNFQQCIDILLKHLLLNQSRLMRCIFKVSTVECQEHIPQTRLFDCEVQGYAS